VRQFLTITGLFLMLNTGAQSITTIYCFPGQGADRRQFDRLTLDSSFRIEVIEYPAPQKSQTMASFAGELAKRIDTSQPYVLLGVSLGGMLCVELTEILDPKKTIIISSARNRNEYPFQYRFQRNLPFYRAIPGIMILAGAKFLQPIVEPDRRQYPELFKSMLAGKDANYMKRTVELIITWDRTSNSKPIWQIHGTNDHTLPIHGIKAPDYIIENGSHMMTVTRANEISKILNEILTEDDLIRPSKTVQDLPPLP
jgi:pimeloyl-ACP methyl ester carboxylesterase